MPHPDQDYISLNGTTADDILRGTHHDEVINGYLGNDRLRGGGGSDKLNGSAGDDDLQALSGDGLVGLRGGAGNDTLEAAIIRGGQAHMFGGGGNDLIIMNLTKTANTFVNGTQRAFDGHHAYGGDGRDVFDLTRHDRANGIIIGRIDDFDAAQDEIRVDGRRLDFTNLPRHVHLFEYNKQQWLQIGDNAYYVIEGARYGGGEDHFFQSAGALDAMLAADKPAVGFIDQRNYVPIHLYQKIADSLQRQTLIGEDNYSDFQGSGANDYVYDQRVRGSADPTDAVARAFFGHGGHDVINAGKGADTVHGGSGNDLLAGGMDNDSLIGGDGNDWLFGGSQNDRIFGGAGRDSIEGGTGADTLYGGAANDLIRGGAGRDILSGGMGNDQMSGKAGRDTLSGGTGHDTLYGGGEWDVISGETGDDALFGQGGDDNLFGGRGQDRLDGGAGADVVNGGVGRDIAYGGSGSDTFVFRDGALIDWDTLSGGTNQRLALLDRIEDFELRTDQIRFAGYDNVHDKSDLRGWQTYFNGERYIVVNVEASNARLLIRTEESGLSWSDLVAAGSFEFL